MASILPEIFSSLHSQKFSSHSGLGDLLLALYSKITNVRSRRRISIISIIFSAGQKEVGEYVTKTKVFSFGK